MIENKKAESLVGIVIGVLLLTFVILGIYSLIIYSHNTNIYFEKFSIKGILNDNTTSIVYKLNTNGIKEGSGFYLHKNNLNKSFDIYTGSSNLKYKYVDKYGELINTGNTDTFIYEREIILEKIETGTNSKIFKILINDYKN